MLVINLLLYIVHICNIMHYSHIAI